MKISERNRLAFASIFIIALSVFVIKSQTTLVDNSVKAKENVTPSESTQAPLGCPPVVVTENITIPAQSSFVFVPVTIIHTQNCGYPATYGTFCTVLGLNTPAPPCQFGQTCTWTYLFQCPTNLTNVTRTRGVLGIDGRNVIATQPSSKTPASPKPRFFIRDNYRRSIGSGVRG